MSLEGKFCKLIIKPGLEAPAWTRGAGDIWTC